MKHRLAWVLLAVLPACAYAKIPYGTTHKCLGGHTLYLQVADTPRAREHGLMGRTTLSPYDGMLFTFPASTQVQMWMKNTPLPLDMLFVDAAGQLVHIEANTTPNSERIIASPERVNAVIELEGGHAAAKGISKGQILLDGACPAARR